MYAADTFIETLDFSNQSNLAYIVNTEQSSTHGRHWVAIIQEPGDMLNSLIYMDMGPKITLTWICLTLSHLTLKLFKILWLTQARISAFCTCTIVHMAIRLITQWSGSEHCSSISARLPLAYLLS